MSRSNPAGFVLGIAVEVAAIVFAIALLPRINLGPTAGEPNAESAPLTFVNQPQPIPQAAEVTNQWREPPRLITVDPNQSGPIEQRLDQASQKLLNTVGSYAVRTAGDIFQPEPNAGPAPPPVTNPAPRATSQLSYFPRALKTQPQPLGASNTPPRPWMRY